MDDSLSYILLVTLFVLSAFFSGSETAFFSLNKFHLKKLESSNEKKSKNILKLLDKSTYLLILILLGNTLVNIAVSSTATLLAIKLNRDNHWFVSDTNPLLMLIQILLTTVLLLTIGEVIPKLFAFGNSEKFAGYASYILVPLGYLLYPIIKPIEYIVGLISKKDILSKEQRGHFTSEDFKNLVSSESADHPLDENEKEIIAGIFRFSTTEVREILLPRVDIIACEINESIEELTKKIKDSGCSRIPIFKETIDEIVGIVYVKDLILNSGYSKITDLMRNPIFCTENTKIQTLFNQFKALKIQIAIIVDEYGGTAGLVTLEDILEEIVGDIHDEYDVDEQEEIKQLGEVEYIISGMVGISDINEKFNLNIDTEEFDNIADYLLSEYNHIPTEKETFEIENRVLFTIASINGQRIEYVKLTILKDLDNEE